MPAFTQRGILLYDVTVLLNADGIESAEWTGLSIGVLLFMCAELTQPWRVKAPVLLDADAGPELAWKKPKYQVMKWRLKHLGPRAIPPALLPIMLGRTALRERAELRSEYAKKFPGMRVDSLRPGIFAIIARAELLSRLPQTPLVAWLPWPWSTRSIGRYPSGSPGSLPPRYPARNWSSFRAPAIWSRSRIPKPSPRRSHASLRASPDSVVAAQSGVAARAGYT